MHPSLFDRKNKKKNLKGSYFLMNLACKLTDNEPLTTDNEPLTTNNLQLTINNHQASITNCYLQSPTNHYPPSTN